MARNPKPLRKKFKKLGISPKLINGQTTYSNTALYFESFRPVEDKIKGLTHYYVIYNDYCDKIREEQQFHPIAKQWMKNNKYDYADDFIGGNYTKIAEGCAIALNHDEWLDDKTHWIWDLAIEVLDQSETI